MRAIFGPLLALLLCIPLSSTAQVLGGVAGGNDLFPELRGTMQTSLPFTLTDGLGYTWDIQHDGSIGDGMNDAFDGAMTMEINSTTPSYTGYAGILEGGREIALPATSAGQGLMVARRVLVAGDDGYARFVELLYNPGSDTINTTVSHRIALGSDDGTVVAATSDGDTMVGPADTGWVTDDQNPSADDPAVAVLFADSSCPVPPRATLMQGNDTPTIIHTVEVPPSTAVAVVLFVAMRTSREEAVSWLGSFDAGAALAELPYSIHNFNAGLRGPMFRVAGLLRGGERDTVELRDGNRLEGAVLDKLWTVETPYGTHEVKLKNVAGLIGGGPGRVGDTVVLLSGEVFVGAIGEETVTLRLPSNKAVDIPLRSVDRIGMRQRSEAEESFQSTADRAVLRQGDRLEGRILGETFQLATPYGTIAVPRRKVASLDLRAEGGRVHQIQLADGSTLSGILLDETIAFRHREGQELQLNQKQLVSLEVPGLLLEPAVDPSSPVLTLSNGDRWFARPTSGSLPIETSFGDLALKLDEISTIRFDEPIAGAVSVKLRDGGSFVGKLGSDVLTLRLGCGLELTVDAAFLGELRIAPARHNAAGVFGVLPIPIR